MKQVCVLVCALVLFGCAGAVATPTPPPTPAGPTPTRTRVVLPTSVDTFYGTPAAYTRQLGTKTQTIRLGISPDFATRPILPLYSLSLTDPKFADRLFEAITYNHFFRWQEAEWAARSPIAFDDFKKRLVEGEDLKYPAMDTRNGGTGAHSAMIDPAANFDILLIPQHDGFVTFPGSQSDPGLSIKNTINADGSVMVRAPLVYAQLIPFKPGDAGIQDIGQTAIILALMELGIPEQAIVNNDLRAIATWWATMPAAELHRFQYSYLQKLLTDEVAKRPILHLEDTKPASP